MELRPEGQVGCRAGVRDQGAWTGGQGRRRSPDADDAEIQPATGRVPGRCERQDTDAGGDAQMTMHRFAWLAVAALLIVAPLASAQRVVNFPPAEAPPPPPAKAP